jgi:hypothetical protein
MEKFDVWAVEVRFPGGMCPVYHVVAAESGDRSIEVVSGKYPRPGELDFSSKQIVGASATVDGGARELLELSLW